MFKAAWYQRSVDVHRLAVRLVEDTVSRRFEDSSWLLLDGTETRSELLRLGGEGRTPGPPPRYQGIPPPSV
jgi:hypothetical protein